MTTENTLMLRPLRRFIKRLGLFLLTAMVVAAAGAALLTYPEPLFTQRVEAGRLSLHSDRPFGAANGRRILADVERRLAAAPAAIADPHAKYRIFVANSEWRRRATFLWHYGAGGLNYYPIGGGSVFIRQSDIDRDRVIRSAGDEVEPPRTLAYFAAHEIAHSMIGKHTGAIGNWRLPEWIREGLADYVGFGAQVDIDGLARAFRAGAEDLDPKRSGTYARYRLLVAFFLERERWSVERLLASGLPQSEAEKRLLASLR